jgi:hypothetical protein
MRVRLMCTIPRDFSAALYGDTVAGFLCGLSTSTRCCIVAAPRFCPSGDQNQPYCTMVDGSQLPLLVAVLVTPFNDKAISGTIIFHRVCNSGPHTHLRDGKSGTGRGDLGHLRRGCTSVTHGGNQVRKGCPL